MEQIRQAIRAMISISDIEMEGLLVDCCTKSFSKRSLLSKPGLVPNEIYFVNKGILRMVINDNNGTEHTTHFATENQFIADYANFMLQRPSVYSLQAIEPVEVVVLPRKSIEWGYRNLKQGDKMGRLIAEYYFIYHDNRIQNMYARTPKQRYDSITEVFPNIHNRVPQHMIASYLGITNVHLSRLKRQVKA